MLFLSVSNQFFFEKNILTRSDSNHYIKNSNCLFQLNFHKKFYSLINTKYKPKETIFSRIEPTLQRGIIRLYVDHF